MVPGLEYHQRGLVHVYDTGLLIIGTPGPGFLLLRVLPCDAAGRWHAVPPLCPPIPTPHRPSARRPRDLDRIGAGPGIPGHRVGPGRLGGEPRRDAVVRLVIPLGSRLIS